ncbi:hypothetical protein F4779DRAFT_327188 [Xylariaceae sp. FL0662B]|nr:hypothetical protein F4779DRAFT_327188 [Xylariaceae sp. FL0662B]
MPSTLARNIISTFQYLVGPEVINNRLNPVHLAIGTWGYWIQAHILHIPDRFGFFSPGPPPPLQTWQGALFVQAAVRLVPANLIAASTCVLWKVNGLPISRIAGGFLAIDALTIAFIWALTLFDSRRAPDYDWGEWNNIREE